MSVIKYEVQVDSNKTTSWYLNGQLHREDGPAIEWTDGSKFWFINGQRHREDGPAVVRPNRPNSWYLNGEQLTESEFNNRTKIKELTVNEIQSLLGHKVKIVE